MAACTFDITFTGSAPELLARARDGIVKQGGTVTGNDTAGSFSIPVLGSVIAGSYAVHGQVAHFEISKKPFLVSCGRIQSGLEEFARAGATGVSAKKKPARKTAKTTVASKRAKTGKRSKKAVGRSR